MYTGIVFCIPANLGYESILIYPTDMKPDQPKNIILFPHGRVVILVNLKVYKINIILPKV